MRRLYKFLIALIVLLALIIFYRQLHKNDRKKDSITFQSPIETVIDSLKVMHNFINNMSIHLDKKSGYRIDKVKSGNDLYVGGKNVVSLSEVRNSMSKSKLSKDSVKMHVNDNDIFNILTDENLTRFINLAIFLNDNYVSSCYVSKYYNTLIFGYRDTVIYDDEDVRNIVFLESILDTTQFLNEVKVYDRKKELILFSPYK